MPITFNCSCGKALRVPDATAGRRVKCPACQMAATVPAARPLFEVVEDEPPAAPPPKARPVAKPTRDDDDKPAKKKPDFGRGSRRRDDDDDDEDDEDRPRRRKRRRRAKTVSATQVWVTIKRVCFGGLGAIILLGSVALTADGIQGGNTGWIARGVCMFVVGASLLFAGITGRFAGAE